MPNSEKINELMMVSGRLLEMVTDNSLNVTVDERIDIDTIKADDESPMFINVEVVRAGISGNNRRYNNAVVREINAMVPGTQGFLGHPDPSKFGFEFREPQCIYVGSMVDVLPDNTERCIAKCYVFKSSPLREWIPKSIAANNPMTVSINAIGDIIKSDSILDVVHITELQSIDWANPGTEGMYTSKAMSVVSEQKSNIGGNKQMDSKEIIKNATVAEFKAYNPEGVTALLKSVTVAELQSANPDLIEEVKRSGSITEMKLTVDGAEKMVKLTELQGIVDAKDNKITELNNTIATMKIEEFKAKKIAELVPEQYREKIAGRITGTTENAITECINNEIAYIREMGGLDNTPGGRQQHGALTDDIKSQIAKLFGHKE
jgi:hypothetical protein